VAFWVSHCVEILSVTDEALLVSICKTSPLRALPRSVLLHDFGDSHYMEESDQRLHLLAGLADGTLVSFTMKDNNLTDSKTISLGDIPVSLLPCSVDSKRVVFASGRRTAVLFWSKERLHHSPVLSKVSSHLFLKLCVNTLLLPGCYRSVKSKFSIFSIVLNLGHSNWLAYWQSAGRQ
jgi:DNA damage-binding protein 1